MACKTQTPALKPCPVRQMTLYVDQTAVDRPKMIRFEPETGGQIVGSVEQVNAILTAMGYERVAMRRNVIGGWKGDNQLYLEAENTPLHCSPASETYWSM